MAAAARPSPSAKAARFTGAGTDYRLSQMPLSAETPESDSGLLPTDVRQRHEAIGRAALDAGVICTEVGDVRESVLCEQRTKFVTSHS